MTEKKAAVYHFTNSKDKHPSVCTKQLEQLKSFAESKGFAVVEIFCDKSLRRCEHKEFDRFLSCCDYFDALIVKDFYHISKNTSRCMELMAELRNKGVEVYSIENGQFIWDDCPVVDHVKIATYTCHFGNPDFTKESLQLQNDILSHFIKKKTNCTVVDQYFDESEHQRDGEQVQLMELVANKQNYDLILVHNLNSIHWRTANFCKVREQLQLDIYSLQEGLLKYTKQENVI